MTTTIHLARHGQTPWHAENRYAGVSDIPLNAVGREQAGALAQWADTEDLGLVASSGLMRAASTAAEVAAVAGLEHVVDDRLREVGFGRAEGMTRREMSEAFPEDLQRFLRAPASNPLPGGEAGQDAASRFLAAITDLAERSPFPVLVVAHTTLIRLGLSALLGLPLDGYRTRFPELGNGTITTVRSVGTSGFTDGAALLRYNAPL